MTVVDKSPLARRLALMSEKSALMTRRGGFAGVMADPDARREYARLNREIVDVEIEIEDARRSVRAGAP